MKKYINLSIIYALIGLGMGVFYREFTKFNGFEAHSSLSIIHTHYLILGTVFFLVLIIFDRLFDSSNYVSAKLIRLYQFGLNITCLMMLVRGVIEVRTIEVSNAISASIAGTAGIGHITLAISLVFILYKIRLSILNLSKTKF